MKTRVASLWDACFGGLRGRTRRSAAVLMCASAAAFAVGCSGGAAPTDADESNVGTVAEALGPSQETILGFESPGGWLVTSGFVSLSPIRTRGASSLAIQAPIVLTTLTSAALSSTAAGLAGLTDPESFIAVDLMLPAAPAHTFDFSQVGMLVGSLSHGVVAQSLGVVSLAGSQTGSFRTIKFPVSSFVRSHLAGSAFSDLAVTITLNVPGGPVGATYRFDNLRAGSPATAPVGPGASVDLVALKSYSPATSTPGQATFDAGVVQVPASFHLKLGNAGTGTATLALGQTGAATNTCTYGAGPAGTSYVLTSCSAGSLAGDLVPATSATLTIVNGNASAGTTKIRAQLALNPVGDRVGRGVIAAIPTFWGDTPSETEQIISAYSQQLNGPTKTEHLAVALPVPEFAKRNSDGSGVDMLDPNVPPPPNDPPFNQEGHMNKGSHWDAYWRLTGALSSNDNGGTHHTTHFNADLSGRVVVWGADINVLGVSASLDTDNGQVNADHFDNPTATGGAHVFLFGVELPGGGNATVQSGFNFNVSTPPVTINGPRIQVWVFTISSKVTATARLSAGGDIEVDGFHVAVTPSMVASGHLFGGVDVGIASGGVDVSMEFINVSTPLTGNATWAVSTDPRICGATLGYTLDGHAIVSSGGGSVDLVATFGVCPFCFDDSWTLLRWKPLAQFDQPLFHFSQSAAAPIPLPISECQTNLTAKITFPAAGAPIFAGIPTSFVGSASRPVPGTVEGYVADCSALTWTLQNPDPSDTGFPATGCTPEATFGSAGTRRITLSATDAFGQQGSVTQDFVVTATPTGPVPRIVFPHDGDGFTNVHITLQGESFGGVGDVTLYWFHGNDPGPFAFGPTVDYQVRPRNENTIRLVAIDSKANSNEVTIHIVGGPT
jgi:hypothetical protein